MKGHISIPSTGTLHPCDMLPGQIARVVAGNGPLAGDYHEDTNRNSLGDTLLCIGWGNGERLVANLSQPFGCWDESENSVMLVELLPPGTEIKLTVEV